MSLLILEDENSCDLERRSILCDPFVKVLIDGKEVLKTNPREETQIYYVGRTITSKKIQKNLTLIEIEVWDYNGEDSKPDLILRANGTVETFMQEPVRCTEGGKIDNGFSKKDIPPNCIEVDVVWQDAREEEQYQTHKRGRRIRKRISEKKEHTTSN